MLTSNTQGFNMRGNLLLTILLAGCVSSQLLDAQSKSDAVKILTLNDMVILPKPSSIKAGGSLIGSMNVNKVNGLVLFQQASKVNADFIAINPKLSIKGELPQFTSEAKKRTSNYSINVVDKKYSNFVKAPVVKMFAQTKDVTAAPPPPPPQMDIPIELGVEKQDNDDELGSAFEEEEGNMNQVEGYKKKQKPCHGQCAKTNEKNDEETEQSTDPEPDIPVELGSAIKEDDDRDVDESLKDQVTYLPIQTPHHFLMIEDGDDDNEGDSSVDGSGFNEGSAASGNDRKRSVNERNGVDQFNSTASFTMNTDGDFDGELLLSKHKESMIESNEDNRSISGLAMERKRRSASQTVQKKEKKLRKSRQKLSKKKLKAAHKSKKYEGKASKRSDIEADKELLQTIENFNSMATKRHISNKEKKPMKRYMKNLAGDVRGVLNEAKTALKDTGRVIRGLRRVISGAGALTSFTNNAVKFAKYFTMEPNNATIDYLEEKAIVSVLEAQRAASDASNAARLAKLAYEKTEAVEKRMEVEGKSHKQIKNGLVFLNTASKQASRAEKAAKLASKYKEETEKDVMFMDKELKGISTQLEAQNQPEAAASIKNATSAKVIREKIKANLQKTQAKISPSEVPISSESQITPDVQLLLPKISKEFAEKASTDTEVKDELAESEDKGKGDENYFYRKQKEMEKQLGNDKGNTEPIKNEIKSNKKHVSSTGNSNIKVSDKIPSNDVADVQSPEHDVEQEYIASLNKKIAAIKREEEDANQRLRAVEIARTFATKKSKNLDDLIPSKTIEESASIRTPGKADLISELLRGSPSLMKTNVRAKVSSSVKSKKGNIRKHMKANAPHIYPGEYTGFKKKKQEIAKANNIKIAARPHNLLHETMEGSALTQKNVKSLVIFPKEKHHMDNLPEDVLSMDENSLVAEDHDLSRKRNRILADAKFKNDRETSDLTGSGSGAESDNSGDTDDTTERNFNQGPVSVTVRVNHNRAKKRDFTKPEQKKEDFIDPFGFSQTPNTNEGGIIDRTFIPKPEQYLTADFKRSRVPIPQEQVKKLTLADVVNDNK